MQEPNAHCFTPSTWPAHVERVPRHHRLGMAELQTKDNIKPVEISHPIWEN
ncbi:hypothetical protein RHMOL_Rhmol11G0037900 [Rhododendron molle]|uniref:Uncharacterized protein n=1 Tax=Rhododendron molle TaxID=49168 RepID=A0ACC0LN52_RHOML|nr:hypothetical protein RHMOL_Rhmol11G0037900 [Rhododendron molle]